MPHPNTSNMPNPQGSATLCDDGDKEAKANRRRARDAERKRLKRAADAELRRREAAAKRETRTADAERKRLKRAADAELRQREAAAVRQKRAANPELRQRDAERKRLKRAANPEVRQREATSKRQRRTAAVREREAASKRRLRQSAPDAARQRERAAKAASRAKQYASADARFKRDFLDHSFGRSCNVCDRLWFDNNLQRVCDIKNDLHCRNALEVLSREFGECSDERATANKYGAYMLCSTCLRLLEPSSAAQYASSKTVASFVAGKSNSLTQCGVPVVFKSSQANLKPKSKSVGVQTQHGRKISAGLVRGKSSAARMVRHSLPDMADIALRLWEELQSRHSATAP